MRCGTCGSAESPGHQVSREVRGYLFRRGNGKGREWGERELAPPLPSSPALDHGLVNSSTGFPLGPPLRFALPLLVRFWNARGVESTGTAVLFVFSLRKGTQRPTRSHKAKNKPHKSPVIGSRAPGASCSFPERFKDSPRHWHRARAQGKIRRMKKLKSYIERGGTGDSAITGRAITPHDA